MPKVVVHVAIRIVPARLEEFKTIFAKLVEASQKEVGTEIYIGAYPSSLSCLCCVLIHTASLPSCSSTSFGLIACPFLSFISSSRLIPRPIPPPIYMSASSRTRPTATVKEDDPNTFRIFEVYASEEAHATHLEAPEYGPIKQFAQSGGLAAPFDIEKHILL
jgi:quinol monooxygenase YgiN